MKMLWIYCITLVLTPINGTAQSDKLSREKVNQEPGKDSLTAHWQIKTLAKTRTTQIQFFGADDLPVYEETLPEKWVKQNRRTRRQLDKLLAQILSSQLLISRLKTESLPPEPYPQMPAGLTRKTGFPADGDTLKINLYNVQAHVSSDGKIYVLVNNPEHLSYKIQIIDSNQKIVYQEFTRLDQYRKKLDISSLISSPLELNIAIGKELFVYQVKQQQTESEYSLKAIVSVNQKHANADSYRQ